MIKYKGITSDLLTDVSLQLGHHVNLMQSEKTLTAFFKYLLQHQSTEEKVALICSLPAYIKPFCTATYRQEERSLLQFRCYTSSGTIRIILSTLKKYMPAETFDQLCRCIPGHVTSDTSVFSDKVFLVA